MNVPDHLYKTPGKFWVEYNKPWLSKSIQRGDVIKLATKPEKIFLTRLNDKTGEMEITGFGREVRFLQDNGYVFDSRAMSMVKNP